MDSPKTIANFWPYATTLFDFIRRAMPFTQPRSLSDEEVYALTAYILAQNKLIGENDVMDAKTLPQVKMPNRDGFVTPLRGLPNVILTPHIGGSTEEAQEDIGEFVAGKLVAYADAGTTTLSVNLPSVQLPGGSGVCRLLVLHVNRPGALAHLNGMLAEREVNVEQQMLATAGTVGYAAIDVSGPVDGGLLDQLRALPETIRVQVLPVAAA